MIQIPNESIDKLIEKAKEGFEVRLEYYPDSTVIEITPWRPYQPICPYHAVDDKKDWKPTFGGE